MLVPHTRGLTLLITNFQQKYWELNNASTDYNNELILSTMADKYNKLQ